MGGRVRLVVAAIAIAGVPFAPAPGTAKGCDPVEFAVAYWSSGEVTFSPGAAPPDGPVNFRWTLANADQQRTYNGFEGEFDFFWERDRVLPLPRARDREVRWTAPVPADAEQGCLTFIVRHGQAVVFGGKFQVVAPMQATVRTTIVAPDGSTARATLGPAVGCEDDPCALATPLGASDCGGTACEISGSVRCGGNTCTGAVTASPCGAQQTCTSTIDWECDVTCDGTAELRLAAAPAPPPPSGGGFPWWVVVVAVALAAAGALALKRARGPGPTVTQEGPGTTTTTTATTTTERPPPCGGRHRVGKTFSITVCESPGERIGSAVMEVPILEAQRHAYDYCRQMQCPPGAACVPVIVEENIGGATTVDTPCPGGMTAWEYTYTLGIIECRCQPRPDISPADMDRTIREGYEGKIQEAKSRLRVVEPQPPID